MCLRMSQSLHTSRRLIRSCNGVCVNSVHCLILTAQIVVFVSCVLSHAFATSLFISVTTHVPVVLDVLRFSLAFTGSLIYAQSLWLSVCLFVWRSVSVSVSVSLSLYLSLSLSLSISLYLSLSLFLSPSIQLPSCYTPTFLTSALR
jgi:hypothetical protein